MNCDCRGRHVCGAPGYAVPPAFENLVGQPITGSFRHTFSDPDGAIVKALSAPTATVTVRYCAKWWQRPWLWIRRRPTKTEHVFEDVHFHPMTIHEDGSVSVDFTAEPRP